MSISNKKIKILIVDDHKVLRHGLMDILKCVDNFEIVGEAANGKEALAFLEDYSVDVVLLNIDMPVMNGHETLINIKNKFPGTKAIMFTTHHELGFENHFLKSGAHAFLNKNCDFEVICETILKVIDREFKVTINNVINTGVSDEYLQLSLSDREKEVLKLMCKDYNSVEIAEALGINRYTAKYIRKLIYDKTRARTLSELIIYAYKQGLIPLE